MRLWLRRERIDRNRYSFAASYRRPGESHHGPVPSQIVHYYLDHGSLSSHNVSSLPAIFSVKGATVHDASIAPNKRQYGWYHPTVRQ